MSLWDRLVCSDEMKFNADGPDKSASCWHDLRRDETVLDRSNFSILYKIAGVVKFLGAFYIFVYLYIYLRLTISRS